MARNKFDSLYLELDKKYLSNIKYEHFKKVIDPNGNITEFSFVQKSPFFLKVTIKEPGTAFLNFTGKILKERYPELISHETLTACIDQLNSVGLFKINSDLPLSKTYVKACDVTFDIESNKSIEEIYDNLTLRNNKKFSIKSLNQLNTSFTIFNTVANKRNKTSLVIYDKSHELNKSENKSFLAWIDNKEEVTEYFKNRIRYELNLHSLDRIRYYFKVDDKSKPTLNDLFNYEEDVIYKFLNSSVAPSSGIQTLKEKVKDSINPLKMNDLYRAMFLCLCGFNMPLVEKTLRDIYPPCTNFRNVISPYRDLVERIKHVAPIDPIELPEFYNFKNKLEMMINITFSEHENYQSNLLLNLYEENKNKDMILQDVFKDFDPADLFNI